MKSADAALRIDRRFNGPPDSGNGGYVCGELAKHWVLEDADAAAAGVRVRLRLPPPLGKELRVESSERSRRLFDADSLVAEAWLEELDLVVPESVDLHAATEATLGFRGYEEHVFPSCFVCGTAREEADGLRIFAGAVPGSTIFAAPWRPDVSLADSTGRVDPSFVWAALDCPGAFSFPQPEKAFVVLGEMTARLDGPLDVDEPCVLIAWESAHDGRKHTTGTAIFGPEGDCRGAARGVWIELPAS